MDTADDGLEVGSLIGAYRIGPLLGEGGMGRVYRAVREPEGDVVALKVIRPSLTSTPEFAKRFEREVRAASEVSHENLVGVVDFGEMNGFKFMAMDYVAGSSLRGRLDLPVPMTIPEVLRVVTEVGAGLDALHAVGLIHRDVKPANVMMDQEGSARLTDFGLARGFGAPRSKGFSVLTKPGQMVGSIEYLAPELIRGDEASPASDIYALGCVAYECLAGTPPFPGTGLFEVGMAILDGKPGDPLAGRPEDLPGLSAVIHAALAGNPEDRPETGAGFGLRLAAA